MTTAVAAAAAARLWSKRQLHRPLSRTLVTFLSTVLSIRTDIWLYITGRRDDQNTTPRMTTRFSGLGADEPVSFFLLCNRRIFCGFIFRRAFIKMQQTYFRQRLFHTKHMMTNNNTFNFPSLMALRTYTSRRRQRYYLHLFILRFEPTDFHSDISINRILRHSSIVMYIPTYFSSRHR